LEFWVILSSPFIFFFLLLLFVTLNRYIGYKERVELARLGYSLEEIRRDAAKKQGSRGVLWGGVITGMSGLALLLGLATLGMGAWLLGGLLPLFVGLGMIAIYFMSPGSETPSAKDAQTAVYEDDAGLAAGLSLSDLIETDDGPARRA
jgi:hypothetical protein